MENTKIHVLIMHDYTGDGGVEAYIDKDRMLKDIEEDIRYVCKILTECGYEWKRLDHYDGKEIEIYVPRTDIYYEWQYCECRLR